MDRFHQTHPQTAEKLLQPGGILDDKNVPSQSIIVHLYGIGCQDIFQALAWICRSLWNKNQLRIQELFHLLFPVVFSLLS